jgi:hypothetical protein
MQRKTSPKSIKNDFLFAKTDILRLPYQLPIFPVGKFNFASQKSSRKFKNHVPAFKIKITWLAAVIM